MSKATRLRRGGQRPDTLNVTDAQRDERFFKERERERRANAEKTAKLRALRLGNAEAGETPAGPDATDATTVSITAAPK